MRKRPSLATVLAALALFFSLSGTAMASLIITKNSQVAAHVIAGAKAPSGDNKNLISGSVGASDLHAGAVTNAKLGSNSVDSSKVADLSLTGGDVANGSITGQKLDANSTSNALGLRHALFAEEPGAGSTFFSTGLWTLVGNCFDTGGGNIQADVEIDVGGSKALLVKGDSTDEVFGPNAAALTLLAQTPPSAATQIAGGDFTVQAVDFANSLSGRAFAAVDATDTSFQGSSITAPFCVFRFDGTGS